MLVLLGGGFWTAVFGVSYRLLRYFKGVEEIGPLLAGKMLAVALLSFAGILLLSNLVTALSTFFLAKDLDRTSTRWSRPRWTGSRCTSRSWRRRWRTRRGWWC